MGSRQRVSRLGQRKIDRLNTWRNGISTADVDLHWDAGISTARCQHDPFRVGTAELGNWNGRGFPDNDPAMIRNFSGAMDEFCLFSRALPPSEIRALYSSNKPQPMSGSAR